MRTRDAVSAVLVVSCLAGCPAGDASRPPATPAETVAQAAPAAAAAVPASQGQVAAPGPGDWATWSHPQKLQYMRSAVLGAERTLFSSFEQARYAGLDCRTCHGPGADDGTFKMPNPELPKLAGGPDGFQQLAAKEPQMLEFMQQKVVPETARLLGLPAFEMKSHKGFSCFQCHTRVREVETRSP